MRDVAAMGEGGERRDAGRLEVGPRGTDGRVGGRVELEDDGLARRYSTVSGTLCQAATYSR